jgi:hypothetical protein
MVKITPPYPIELDKGISNVVITAVVNGQVLTYEAASGNWINAAAAGGGDLKADGTVPLTGNWTINDDVIVALGTNDDIAILNRSTSLAANTALANVFVGVPVTPALAANSAILSNITADGDIVLATQTGGNSQANIFIDASVGSTHILAAGVSQFNVALGRVNIYDDIILQLGTNGDQALLNRSTTLNANTALGNALIGTPVTPALAANSLIISNITADGDIEIAANDGGNSKACLFFDASTPDLYLYNVGGTWTGGATTWTIPAVTLGGTLDVNAQTLDNVGSVLMAGNITLGEYAIDLDESIGTNQKYSGITCQGVYGASLVFGDFIYLAVADGRWEKTDADAEATAGDVMLGIALETGNDGDSKLVFLRGFIRDDSWNFTNKGDALYLSTTLGTATQTRPLGSADIVRVVGYAHDDADTIYFNPDNTWIEIA